MGNTLKAAMMGIGFMVMGAVGATTLSATAAPDADADASAETVQVDGERDGRKEGRRGHGRHRGGKGMMQAIESLELTADQQAEIEAIQEGLREARGEPRERGERGGPMALLTAETIDRDAAHAALSERQVREHDKLDGMLDMLEVLTPEQRAELAEKAEEHRGHRRGGDGERERR